MKIKTKRKSNKKVLIVLGIVLLAVVVAVSIGLLIYKVVDNEMGKEMAYIDFSVYPTKRTYYVGEEFDPTGIKIQAMTKNGSSTYINNASKLEFSGFDSSEPCEKQWITVTYQGVSVQYDIAIIELPKPTPTLESIEVYDLKTEYSMENWNKYGVENGSARIRCIYSDGSVEDDIPLKYKYIYGVKGVSAPGTLDITVRYSDGVTTVETTVTITITE